MNSSHCLVRLIDPVELVYVIEAVRFSSTPTESGLDSNLLMLLYGRGWTR